MKTSQCDVHKDITSPPYNVTIIKTKLGNAFFHIQPTGRQPTLPCYKEEGVHGGGSLEQQADSRKTPSRRKTGRGSKWPDGDTQKPNGRNADY